MPSTRSEWGSLDEMLLALNIKAEKRCLTYHLIVTSKFNHQRKNWNRITKIAKFDISSGKKPVIIENILINSPVAGIEYAIKEMSALK